MRFDRSNCFLFFSSYESMRSTPTTEPTTTSAGTSPVVVCESPSGAKRTWGDATTLSLTRPAGIGLQGTSSGEKWRARGAPGLCWLRVTQVLGRRLLGAVNRKRHSGSA
jgi:hypothetical protein